MSLTCDGVDVARIADHLLTVLDEGPRIVGDDDLRLVALHRDSEGVMTLEYLLVGADGSIRPVRARLEVTEP